MPFHLEITFAGMCLLVRDMERDRTPRMLHVLMPDTGAHVHLPTLAYLTAHEIGSPVPDPVTTHDVAGRELLDLASLTASNGFDLTMPRNVFDFEQPPLAPREVSRALLDGATLPADVVFRTRLAAGLCTDHRPGGFWFVQVNDAESSHRMATAVTWRLENVPLATLALNLGGGVRPVLTPLPDANGELVIRLMIVNVTPEEFETLGNPLPLPSRCPPDREPGHHFTHYFPLLDPRDPSVVPEFDEARTRAAGACDHLPPISEAASPIAALANFAGSEFTCMITTAPAFR